MDNNLGIGTTTPGTLLQLEGSAPYITLKNDTSENSDGGCESRIIFEDHANVSLARIQGSHDGSSDDTKGDLIFSTHDGSSLTEALRIDSSQKATFASGFDVGSDAAGDILYHNGTSYVRLPKGTADHVLTMNDAATAPGWEAASGGGSNTFVMSQAIEQTNSLSTSYYYYKNVVGGYGYTNNFSPTNFTTSFPYWRVGRYASSGTIPVAANLTSYHLVGHKDGSDDDTMTLKVWKVPAPANGDAEADIPTLVEVISVEIDVDGNEMFNKNGTLTSTNSFAAGDQWMITLAPTSAYMTSDHYAHLTLVFEPS